MAEKQSLGLVVLTAALTTLITVPISTVLPVFLTDLVRRVRNEPVFIVHVIGESGPIEGSQVAITSAVTSQIIASGKTNKKGYVALEGLRTGSVVGVEAVIEEGTHKWIHSGFVTVPALPATHALRKIADFNRAEPVKVVSATIAPADPIQPVKKPAIPGSTRLPQPPTVDLPSGSPSTGTGSRSAPPATGTKNNLMTYGEALLLTDRKASAVVEIDWVKGTARPELAVQTREGIRTLADLLRQSGIEAEVRWSDEIPIEAAGSDGRFSANELNAAMSAHRNVDAGGRWHFYLILAPRHAGPPIKSLLFDSERRMGAVVFLDQVVDPREIVWCVIHEIGHELNLPHPFQAYGDTRSVMTYGYRWPDWSYDDPGVYLFDEFGQFHIRRAPAKYVQPGGSKFLEYGAPLNWPGAA